MRKIFTFLCAALMSVGMFATTVTWDNSTLSSINMKSGSFTKDGVTLTLLDGRIAGTRDWRGNSVEASFKFSTSLGNFTRIEITATIYGLGGSGWTETSPGAVWTGEANETTFGMYFRDVSQIVFTIEESTVAVTGVTLNQNEAQMTVGGETLTLTATVNPNNATDQSVSWSTSDANVATVENGVVTAVAAGNATITVTTTDGSFTATCAVTVTAPEPAGQVITWDNDFCSNVIAYSDWSGQHVEENNTKDGITVTSSDSESNGMQGGLINLYYQENILTFTSTVGDISKIEVYYSANYGSTPNGWTLDATNKKFVWEGTAAAAVDMVGGYVYFIVDYIVFTIAGSTPTAVENVQTNHVQGTKILRDGMLLIEKNGKIYNVMGAEVK